MQKDSDEIEKLIGQLQISLIKSSLKIEEYNLDTLHDIISSILEKLTFSYDSYKQNIPKLLSVLEKTKMTSVSVLIYCYLNESKQLYKVENTHAFDQEILEQDTEGDTAKVFMEMMATSLGKGAQFGITNFNLKSAHSEQKKKSVISLITEFISLRAEKTTWTPEEVSDVQMQLPLLRVLLLEFNSPIHFYYVVGSVIERLITSGYNQPSRDLAEEIVMSSYQDNVEHWGFFNSMKCYSTSGTAIPALLYGLMSIEVARKKDSLCDKFLVQQIWQGIKMFREISIPQLAVELYESRPLNINYSNFEKRYIQSSYFTCMLHSQSEELPSKYLDFLNENREIILHGGPGEAIPHLIMLLQIKELYPNADFSATGLGFYLSTFEHIVPSENIAKEKALIKTDYHELITIFKRSLVNLILTRAQEDFVNDNNLSIKIATRLIPHTISKVDVSNFLLLSMIKTDYSVMFIEKKREGLTTFEFPEDIENKVQEVYGNVEEKIELVSSREESHFLWSFVSSGKCYQMRVNGDNTLMSEVLDFDVSLFNRLSSANFFSKQAFDESEKNKGEVRIILPEEHEEEDAKIKKELPGNFAIPEDKKEVLVVMDMELSELPHNFLKNQNGDFIYRTNPLCNILNLEWYIANKDSKLSDDFTKTIWIPTEGGDFTINLLNGKLEDALEKFNFNVYNSLDVEEITESDIKVIVSHGANDIAINNALYPDGTPRLDLKKHIGKGKILVLFVCHSGSIKSTPFENSQSSIIKLAIDNGYKAVIAPFWSLHVSIPPLWLNKFLEAMSQKKTLNEAMYLANYEVHSKFPIISASGCLHLYGCPHLKLNS